MGSSPLARGLLEAWVRLTGRAGIIPARAGFTARLAEAEARERDHPRSRGVYDNDIPLQVTKEGSSPLARGLPHALTTQESLWRIIPARAGFTLSGTRPRRGWRDHPRSRGVYRPCGWPLVPPGGSSPLARGLRGPDPSGVPGLRIIPARAGFTGRRIGSARSAADHPRSRGVYLVPNPSCGYRWGSSPLARGLRPTLPQRLPRRRIIPARAGFTGRGAFQEPKQMDHPRSRGVYGTCVAGRSAPPGSSPLARGLPGDCEGPLAAAGIIPARAGFT